MKIDLDIDDNSFLLDLKGQIFISLLKSELKDNREYLSDAWNDEAIKMCEDNIKACLQLLDYYGGKDE